MACSVSGSWALLGEHVSVSVCSVTHTHTHTSWDTFLHEISVQTDWARSVLSFYGDLFVQLTLIQNRPLSLLLSIM